jgi:hypothetical protein
MPFDAFISYSSKDKIAADTCCAVLEKAGVRCWIAPRDVKPGSEYGTAIIDGIRQSRLMVLIFSSSANDSSQIRREIERALARACRLSRCASKRLRRRSPWSISSAPSIG